ncbi:MAG: CTP-dependent riboflavin kinase [Desulfurococcales archaeon]|nr:CTP-dependent riboflavin kinase [Desulfurococcales archaeon]
MSRGMAEGGDCERVRVEGAVFSGRGEGGFYVGIYAKQFEKVIGYRPYPGTLNLRIREGQVEALVACVRRANPLLVEPPRIEGARLGGVYVYRARIHVGLDYRDVYVVRPAITHYKWDVVEVISNEYLRGEFKLKDGDVVELEVYCC